MADIMLRNARADDAQLLFSWRNDGETRQQSRHTGPISWEEHKKWFDQALKNPECIVVVAENETADLIGTARADIHGDEADVSYTISPEFRGKKLSKPMVQLFVREYLAGKKIVAYIKKGHIPSESVARALGLSPVAESASEDTSDLRPLIEWR